MRVYDAKNIKYYDKLTEKRHKVWVLKILFFSGLIIAVIGLFLYVLFFSGFLVVKDISVSGLDKISSNNFRDELDKRLSSQWLGFVERQRNMLFFNSNDFRAEALSAFPEIKELTIKKELPHTLAINVIERATAGIWCFKDGSTEESVTICKYFDKEGKTWGKAVKSSGFLILVVDDLRPGFRGVDFELLADILFISEQLKDIDIFVSKFTIPKNFIGDFSVATSKNYELLFSTDFDIRRQIEALKVFLAEKQDEADFYPRYIDLRINGRIYHK